MFVSNSDINRPSEEPLLPPPRHKLVLGPIPGTLHRPSIILVWQLLTCAFAWSFVIVLAYKKQIPLSDELASLIHQYQTEKTLIATLVATMLSTPTTWFFHAAVRQAVVPFLSRRVSLFQLCSVIQFSMGSFVLSKRHARWSVMTLLCVGLLGTLTSAWSSIITPNIITLDLQLTGQEVDFSSMALMNSAGLSPDQLQSYQAESDGVSMADGVDDIINSVNYVNTIAAGVQSVIGGLGYTSILSFVGGAYNISTGGTMAINNPMIPGIQAWGSTTYGDIYPHVTLIGSEYYHGLSSNQTLIQQGLTASVSCQSQDLSDPTSFPYIVLSNLTSNVSGINSTSPITSWSWNTTCSDNVFSYVNNVITLDNLSDNVSSIFLAGSVCPLQSFVGPSNQSFLIALEVFNPGSYSGSQLCEVTPLLTRVQVVYGGGIINIGETLSSSTFDQIDPSGLIVYGIGQSIGDQIYAAQASNIVGNAMLDNINSFFTTALPSTDTGELNWELIFEDYFRGSVEAWITGIRFYAISTLNYAQIPANMSVPVNGTMQVTTIGWKFSTLGSLTALLPITATFLLSVLALLWPRLSQHHAGSRNPHVVFDPSSIMSIIRASAAGGMSDFFQGLPHASESAEDTGSRFLHIGLTNDKKIGFVESETPPFDIRYPHTDEETAFSVREMTCGLSRSSTMDTSTCSATLAVKEEDDPNSEKMG